MHRTVLPAKSGWQMTQRAILCSALLLGQTTLGMAQTSAPAGSQVEKTQVAQNIHANTTDLADKSPEANSDKSAEKATDKSTDKSADKSADKSGTAAKDSSKKSEATLDDLQRLLLDQAKTMEALQQQLKQQQIEIDALKSGGASAAKVPVSAGNAPASVSDPANGSAAAPAASSAATVAPQAVEPGPLSLRIGSAYITPVGFMDFTGFTRSTNNGSGIGTNFGSIPFSNTPQGNLSETRLSAQNSRVGFRVDAKVNNSTVLGYLESDFLGFTPLNAPDSSSSYSLRLRLYWVDVKTGKFEVLGGQSWSMLTPGRKGISPLPGDLFYSQNVDVNYQVGLTWTRAPQVRFVYHPNDNIALGVSFENPEQYIGGSAGGSTVTLPSALAANAGFVAELGNGGVSTLNAPNLHPDIIPKFAVDHKFGDRDFHFEVAGLVSSFKTFNPLTQISNTTTGGGGSVNLNIEVAKGFRFITNNFFGAGGGRYLFGQSPDIAIRPDGSPSLINVAANLSGFEYQANPNNLLYAYYGGMYVRRDVIADGTVAGKFVGYGFAGSTNQNREIQEGTFGITHTFWRDPKWGALQLMGQYSYLTRSPWSVAAGTPSNAHLNMVFVNLRYVLPGSAPKKVD